MIRRSIQPSAEDTCIILATLLCIAVAITVSVKSQKRDPALGNGSGSHKAYFLINLANFSMSDNFHMHVDYIREASYMACFLGMYYLAFRLNRSAQDTKDLQWLPMTSYSPLPQSLVHELPSFRGLLARYLTLLFSEHGQAYLFQASHLRFKIITVNIIHL